MGLLISLLMLCLFLWIQIKPPSTRRYDLSLSEHQRLGSYRVLYKDGALSQRFLYEKACEYAEMFDGKVVSSNYQVKIK